MSCVCSGNRLDDGKGLSANSRIFFQMRVFLLTNISLRLESALLIAWTNVWVNPLEFLQSQKTKLQKKFAADWDDLKVSLIKCI